MGSSLRVPRFDHESRIDYRDKNELMMSDLDVRVALGDRSDTEQRRPTGSDDGEETVSVCWTAFCMFLQRGYIFVGLVSGPIVGLAFAAACPTRMSENSVVEIMTLRGLAMTINNTFLTLRVDTIPGTSIRSLGQ